MVCDASLVTDVSAKGMYTGSSTNHSGPSPDLLLTPHDVSSRQHMLESTLASTHHHVSHIESAREGVVPNIHSSLVSPLKTAVAPSLLQKHSSPSSHSQSPNGQHFSANKPYTQFQNPSTQHGPQEEGRTRSNRAKLREPRFYLDARKHFLTVRTPRVWNGLPREVIEAPSVRVFKERLDIHMVGMS
ncbi:Zinc finger protein GLIS1 [Varanus komodoensis]|nr:Zinc finger protein GLIS1 [Varanus komodoensis]